MASSIAGERGIILRSQKKTRRFKPELTHGNLKSAPGFTFSRILAGALAASMSLNEHRKGSTSELRAGDAFPGSTLLRSCLRVLRRSITQKE